MSTCDVKKLKKIANRRIYIEQAIRRLKHFRILKYELPVTLNQHLDYIMKSVGEKCNLYPPLIKYNSNFTLIHVHVSFLLYLCAKTAHKCIHIIHDK